jgi:RND family efflux transporter MFP subunit
MTRYRLHPLVAGALALTLTGCSHPSVEEVDTSATVPVSVETAKMEPIQSTIGVTGVVTPAPGADWQITAPEAARIAEMPKAEGDSVKVGDLLVRFDIPSMAADLAAKKAAVSQADARLNLAKGEVGRLAPLVDQGVAAQRDLDAAKREQSDAEADVQQAQGGVDAATALNARAIVHATFPGVVAKRFHNPGDLVDASASDPVLRVINPTQLQVVAEVPVAYLPSVAPGRPAEVTSPGSEDIEPITVLTRPAQVDPTSATADVRLAFKKPTALAAGTTVQVRLITGHHDQALVIPSAAVVKDDDDTFVMVVTSDNKAHKHKIVLGLTTETMVEVTSGLTAGDQVVVRGQDGLPDGAAVTVVK